MLPIFTLGNGRYCSACNTKAPCDLGVFHAIRVKLSNFKDLSCSQFGNRGIFTQTWLGVTCSSLGNLIGYVVGICPKKQMFRINTYGIVAFMKTMQSIWDRAMVQFVGEPMRRCNLSLDTETTVAPIQVGLPYPTPITPMAVNVLPKSGFSWRSLKARAMASNEANRLSLNVAMAVIGVVCNWSWHPATAHTEAIRVRRIQRRELGVMVFAESNRLSLDQASALVGPLSNGDKLSTATMAITVGNFLGGVLRGMIVHVISSLLASGQSRGRFQRRSAISIGNTGGL